MRFEKSNLIKSTFFEVVSKKIGVWLKLWLKLWFKKKTVSYVWLKNCG